VTQLEAIIAANKNFVKPDAFSPLSKSPQKQLAIFTCMDTRLVDFLEPAS
jgi:carbonic anhydrase